MGTRRVAMLLGRLLHSATVSRPSNKIRDSHSAGRAQGGGSLKEPEACTLSLRILNLKGPLLLIPRQRRTRAQ
jgi:hypothetical protein